MDPFARRFMWGVIQDVADKREQSVVVLTTHSMEEAQALCSKIGIQVDGQMRCFGSAQQIKDVYGHGYEALLKFKPTPMDHLMKEAEKYDVVYQPGRVIGQLTSEEQAAVFNGTKVFIEDLAGQLDKQFIRQKLSTKGPEAAEKLNDLLQAPFFASEATTVQASIFFAWSIDHDRMLSTIVWLSTTFGKVQRTQMNLPICRLRLLEITSANLGALFEGFVERKEELGIAQYACEQSSLEQIFNDFAREQENNKMYVEAATGEASNSFSIKVGPDGQTVTATASKPLAAPLGQPGLPPASVSMVSVHSVDV